ncbi:probable cytochrome P450 304a1 [Hyposmocoma kahamanoa]|uniref:probable cytochrome P450 304a1 n=1 Tax=Hyposmocoma kahamanoa TaxID=1477025 RepID=UPI000E6D73E2|nr:probable cytochrome P450 304a1 [Hyposmocoma kahamanoa]
MISAVVAVLFISFLLVYLYKGAYSRPKNFPPGPPRLPYYGSYYYIRALDFNNLANSFTKLGQIYKTKIVGCYLASFPTVVVNDSDLIKEMLYNEECDGRMDVILFRLRSYWKKLGNLPHCTPHCLSIFSICTCSMPYTEACIREAMRIDTLVPLGVPHRATADTKLGGYHIPEDTMIGANYTTLHMDKKIWGDPENFRPERFITDGKLNLALDKSLPFGAGRRLCAGETYARQTMFQVFSAFMQAFHVSTADGKPLTKPTERIQGIIISVPEFWVRVTPRE